MLHYFISSVYFVKQPLHVSGIFVAHHQELYCIRGRADKFLARPTSRCRRTDSIVSFERGVCSCAELQGFSSYRCWKEVCQATRAISTTSRRELSSFFFLFPLQGKSPKEIHAILTETLGEHAPSYIQQLVLLCWKEECSKLLKRTYISL